MRELGTRDRVLGDARLEMPMELRGDNHVVTTDEEESSDALTPVSQVGVKGGAAAGEQEDLLTDPLVDINKYRFNKKTYNFLRTTCPIVPKFHSTFGEPIERQEISQETDQGQNPGAGPNKGENRKLVGRVDTLYKHEKTGLNLVKDDFGVHILYDSALADMRSMETELLKVCSFYINKVEPMQDNDLKNVYPIVDRLKILDDVLHCESRFQEAKSHLVAAYLECFEHSSDCLEQQRLVQAMVDEMAKRPKLNLSATHFRDSYEAEIECLQLKTRLVRELMAMLMEAERQQNHATREYLEKAYRLLHEHLNEEWEYLAPEAKEDELNQREVRAKQSGGGRHSKNDRLSEKIARKTKVDHYELERRKEAAMQKVLNRHSGRFSTLADLSRELGIPLPDLKALLEPHHERDHLVRQSVHEHISFIKMNEGYPQFFSHSATQRSKFKFTEHSEEVGVLDFYESLQTMPKAIACIEGVLKEVTEAHRPDNGQQATALEIASLKVLAKELKRVKAGEESAVEGMHHLTDDFVVGNSDKMLFFTKELAASVNDPKQAQNPFVMAKLDIDEVERFDFVPYMGYIEAVPQAPAKEAALPADINAQPIQNKNFGKFFAKLEARTEGLQVPSMLVLMCNSVEVLRLRSVLLGTVE